MKSNPVNKGPSPFYEPPPRKTSAEIINEARIAIRESQIAENSSFAAPSIKPLQTQRPFTPRDKERLLFGKTKANRPPSSFSLRYLQNETNLPSTPPDSNLVLVPNMVTKPKTSASKLSAHHRSSSLSEINDKIFNIPVKDITHKVKLPSLDSCRPLQKRKIFKNTTSLDNLPEETELPSAEPGVAESRNAFSSPQERTVFNQSDSIFGRPSLKQQNLSQQIIEHSETLFLKTGFFARQLVTNKTQQSILAENKTERNVENVLKDLNDQHGNVNEEDTNHLLLELYECMEKEKMLDPKVPSKLKIQILKCLYKFVESRNEQILINIAKVILSLKVTGNNLSGVCKLIFKVAKNDQNDNLFFQKNLLELFLDALGRSSPLDDAEACVYGYGAVKFLTMNPKLSDKILDLGILQLMILHIKIINMAKTERNVMPDQTSHALFQLTGALRNLVSEELVYDTFISCGAITQLCRTLEIFSSDLDIVANISRTLSIISTNECCCDKIVEHKDIYKIFINLFDKYSGNEEIIIRLTYTLGNIVAKIDNTRIKYFSEERSIECLIDLWKIYLERTLYDCSLKVEKNEEPNSNSEDVMIKIIRVIANMVINPEIGKELNEKYGSQLIDQVLKVLISNPFKKNEELVLSILSTLNNLSYYYTNDMDVDIFHVKQIDIVEGIEEFTRSKNRESVIETMRILGNLSRSKITRNFISESNIYDTLILLLEKGLLLKFLEESNLMLIMFTVDPTLLKTTIGVFVNLMSDNRSRILFKKKGGVGKLIEILKEFCENDWSLGSLVCQVLWNYCIDTIDLYELLSEKEIQQLLVLLADYLDEEKLFGVEEHTEDTDVFVTQEYLVWEEFANVATNLLEKIEYFLDTFDQINIETDKETSKTIKDNDTTISISAWYNYG
ncbi:hypothetical protein NQ315_008122 [Exocentrus adspersus]|uniref:Armadillo repeat-containing protein 2 n=1 Tax=Exocentrus adspersus TaxID=1586481 RepID=A0AAV8VWV7_9CUCU|nr:hypothetical protein NQ315_008122 [Exocentrus adspersus]